MNLRSISNLENIEGKKVFVRLELDVPIENGIILDDFRIKQSLPTLQHLRKAGAKIILAAHIGRDPKNTLKPVYDDLKKIFPISFFVNDYFSEESAKIIEDLKPEEAILLENLRKYSEEEKNDETFARKLSGLADFYVNEAFAVSHRSHASIVGIPRFIPGYAGLELVGEVENLSKAFKPSRPFLFILGGAKFETKIPLIKKFLSCADSVFVGGAPANNFFKAKGYAIGQSLFSKGSFHISDDLKNPRLILPVDVVAFDGKKSRVCLPTEVKPNEKIWDAGPKALAELKKLIASARFILWNGPLGDYEQGLTNGTFELARLISESSAESIVGGGDTLASIKSLRLSDKFSFVSTGGGAMLDFLVDETLPGIEALNKTG